VQSPPRVIPKDSTVTVLIDSKLRGWKAGLISTIFSPEETKLIASIPLCPTLPPDRLVWQGTTKCVFLVRSAYHMGMEIKEHNNGSTSKEGSGHSVWFALCSLGILNIVRIFMWRTYNDPLPTKCNLFK
jgi:hypothetical protein